MGEAAWPGGKGRPTAGREGKATAGSSDATDISRDADAAACGHGAIHRRLGHDAGAIHQRFGHDARRGGYRQSGDDGVVVHWPIGVTTWAQLASEEIVLLVCWDRTRTVSIMAEVSGRNLEANLPTMAAAHTDPRSTMHIYLPLGVSEGAA
uniref:Uncharacterized protein n=1 Tax=Oryza meridionalis TaxID=40149 RepID=A0A0E0E5G7_9ORYZ